MTDRLSRTLRQRWRTLKIAAWLGWEMDSNWTEPWLFILYSVIKPVASAFILVLMYVILFVAVGQNQDPASFAYLYVGNSFFIFVGSVLFGTFQVIQSDREWYETMRYVYIAPMSFYTYVVGRAASKVAVAALAVIITLAFGVGVLGVRLAISPWNLPVFAVALALGLVCLVAIGLCLAGVSFMIARHTSALAEGIPGLFFVFCGVLYPLTVLPAWIRGVGTAIPLTYWFDLTRRVLLPPSTIVTGLEQYSNLQILAILAASSFVFFLLSIGIFKLGEYLARKAGKIDMLTSY